MSAEPLTMYCRDCGTDISVPALAFFPKSCPNCGGGMWQSMPPLRRSLRADWTTNDEGTRVPRRTSGSVADGFSHRDFTLVCKLCGDDYGNEPDLPIGVVGAHFRQQHPESRAPDGEPHVVLELLWLGQGPSPRKAKAP